MILGGCDTGPGESLFDPDDITFAPDPVIASVEPSGSALAGVDVLTITGENFSPDPARTRVYFGDVRGEVLELSPTQIRVKAPNLVREELRLRVMVLGAENFSNSISYRLDPAAERFGSLQPLEEPFGITADASGNAYVTLFDDGSPTGIQQITPDGQRSLHFFTTFTWRDLAFGPDGELYGVRGIRAVFRLPEGGTQQVFFDPGAASGATLEALEFAPDGALWTASSGGLVYRFMDGEAQEFAFSGTIWDIAIFQNHLYVALTDAGVSKIVRAPILGGGELGATEEYAAITGPFNVSARRMAFAADGSLLVGTTGVHPPDQQQSPPLILISPGGAAEPFYPGIVTLCKPPEGADSAICNSVRSMAWGAGTHLYAVARVAGDESSRNRDLPDVIQIETRKEGAR